MKGKREGLAEGIEKGIKQGIERGIEKGIEQGIEKQRLETAKEMLRNHCNDQLIQLCTKISVQQLEQLKKEIVSGFSQTEDYSEQSHLASDWYHRKENMAAFAAFSIFSSFLAE